MIEDYQSCTLCPRKCTVDRNSGQIGICGVAEKMYIARASLHHWEEPCISGTRGSGTVFFSGCSLKCVFCQNYELSHAQYGKPVTIDRLVELFFDLESRGAHNINLVTPDHYIPSIAIAMEKARVLGLKIPYLINCSGYETRELLARLSGLADIYLMDFKYMDSEKAGKYSKAYDYPERAMESLGEMFRQVPECHFSQDGIMEKGIIVRHLLMPGMVRNAKAVVDYIYENYRDRFYLSLMWQFTPLPRLAAYPEINRKVTKREYERLLNYVMDKGIEKVFIQESGAAEESFVPLWDFEG